MINSKLFKFVLFVLFINVSTAQHKRYTFEHLTTERGLTQNGINFITMDTFGYIWIATEDGLNRYDGYEVKTFRFDPSDKNSPRGNWMNRVYSDSKGRIYIAQAIGGFDIYDQATGKFTSLVNDPDDTTTISGTVLPSAFLEDTDGNIWIGYPGQGLNKYYPKTGKVERFLPNRFDKNSISGIGISSIYQDITNDSLHIWVATLDRGMNKLNIRTNKVERFGWRDVQYSQALFEFVESKISSDVRAYQIVEVKDNADIQKEFVVERKSKFIVICSGEAYQRLKADYGFISMNDKIIWEFDQLRSFNAGGSIKNRILIDVIELEKGKYKLNYASDENHSYNSWNEIPPERPNLWGISLIEISPADAKIVNQYLNDINCESVAQFEAVFEIISDSTGDLLLAAWGEGLVKLNNRTNTFQQIFMNKEITHPDNFIRNIGRVNDRIIWTINRDFEFNLIDIIEKKKIEIPEKIIVQQTANTVTVDKYKNIWIAQGNKGLYKISLLFGTAELKHFTHDENDKKSISSNSIRQIYSDKFGNTWIGTFGNGVSRINPGKIQFNIALDDLTPNVSGDYPSVSSFAEDAEGNIYIGTLGKGLFQFNDSMEQITQVKEFKESRYIRSLMIEGDTIWIGTLSKGFYLFDIKTKRVLSGIHKVLKEELSESIIYFSYKDSKNFYWIGTAAKGLYKLDPFKNSFKQYKPDQNYSDSLPSLTVWSIYEDKYNTLWIGTSVGGLSKYNYNEDNFTNYYYDEFDPASINNRSFTCFAEDEKENLWIGTYSGGINKYDRSADNFSYTTINEGLPNNRIDGLLVDDNGFLWASTNNGLARFDPNTGQIKKYSMANGLQSNEFVRGAFYKSKKNRMFFGGTKGLNYFDPTELREVSGPPEILLTDFRKFNKSIRFGKPLNLLDEIELSYFDNHFSFEFIALDYSNPQNSTYSYKLEGFDESWINAGSRRFASYTNLNPGKYTFRVKAANGEGIWNEKGTGISLIITPPFWLTWWFIILIFFSIASILWLLHMRRLKIKITQTLAYERIRVNERERVREDLARDFHDELGHKLTRITVFVRRLKKQLNGSAAKIIDDLNNVSETSNDLRIGAKDLIWTLKPDEDTLYDLVIRLKDFGDDLFNGTGIKFFEFGISEKLKKYKLQMDWKRHLVMIFKESMNNSLKYAHCQKVELKINVENDLLNIYVSDDGIGFNTLEESPGYGIDNIKARAKKINGELNNISEVGKGTTIMFTAKIHDYINESESTK